MRHLWALWLLLSFSALAADSPLSSVVIRNGGMSQGKAVPADWRGKFGECTVARDTTTFKEGPASLCVSVDGRAGQAYQKLEGLAGKRIKIAGVIKSSGEVKAQVAIQSFGEKFSKNQWDQISFVQGATDWTAFEKEVAIPEWAAWCNVLLLVEGKGKAWLDEVRDANGTVDAGKAVSEAQEMTQGPPEKDKPDTAGWGFYPQFPTAWQSKHQEYLARTKKGDIDVLFLGDSITQGWGGEGKAVWEKELAPLKAANYGIGGDSTRQVLWRIEHGELEALKPKVVVVKIGTNNLYNDHNGGSEEEIAAGVAQVLKKIRAKLPEAKILLLAILPRQNSFFCDRINRINPLLAKLADGKNVCYLDMTDQFLESPGKVKKELYIKDELHLSEKGYQVWAHTMLPVLKEMMEGRR